MEWRPNSVQNGMTPDWHLLVGGKPVAWVARDVRGRWFSVVRFDQAHERWLRARCGSAEQGRRWVDRWAAKNLR